jgi:hypothetical protein
MEFMSNKWVRRAISIATHVAVFACGILQPGTALTICTLAVAGLAQLGFHGAPSDVPPDPK